MSFLTFSVLLLCSLLVLTGATVFLLYRSGRKSNAFRTIIISFTLLLCWGVTEAVMYFTSEATTVKNPWFIWAGNHTDSGHPNLPYRRKANVKWTGIAHGDLAVFNNDRDPYAREITYQTDADGFNNVEGIDKSEVVFIGDSYTEAGNVSFEENFCQKFKKLTDKSVKNLGVSGYTTPHESIILGLDALKLQPKTVVLQIAESNDLIEAHRFLDWVEAGRPKDEYMATELSKIDVWQSKSPTYKLFQFCFPFALNEHKLEAFYNDAEDEEILLRFYQPPNQKMSPKLEKLGWDIMRGSILRMKEVCEENKIRLLVMLIPDKITVLAKHVEFKDHSKILLESYPDLPADMTLAIALSRYCAELKIDFLDLQPQLEALCKNGELPYLPMDTHLSPAGHSAVAEILSETVGK